MALSFFPPFFFPTFFFLPNRGCGDCAPHTRAVRRPARDLLHSIEAEGQRGASRRARHPRRRPTHRAVHTAQRGQTVTTESATRSVGAPPLTSRSSALAGRIETRSDRARRTPRSRVSSCTLRKAAASRRARASRAPPQSLRRARLDGRAHPPRGPARRTSRGIAARSRARSSGRRALRGRSGSLALARRH